MAEQQIFKLIPKVMSAIGAIPKDRTNEQQHYRFRGIDDVYAALQPALIEYGVFIAPEVLEQKREEKQTKSGGALFYTILTVRFRFYADDGSHVEVVTVGEAMDTGDKSTNKAQSAAMKYACLQLFCVPTEENEDADAKTYEPKGKVEEKKKPICDGVHRIVNGVCENCGEKFPLAAPEQVAELIELLERYDLKPGTVEKWTKAAKVTTFNEMTADAIAKCIVYVKEKGTPKREQKPPPFTAKEDLSRDNTFWSEARACCQSRGLRWDIGRETITKFMEVQGKKLADYDNAARHLMIEDLAKMSAAEIENAARA